MNLQALTEIKQLVGGKFLTEFRPDVFIGQETKGNRMKHELYHVHESAGTIPSEHGTIMLVLKKLGEVIFDTPLPNIQTCYLKDHDIWIVNVYCPPSQTQKGKSTERNWLLKKAKEDRVIIGGDFNDFAEHLDLCHFKKGTHDDGDNIDGIMSTSLKRVAPA